MRAMSISSSLAAVLLVYDQSSSAELNAAATRLTTNLRDGLEVQARCLHCCRCCCCPEQACSSSTCTVCHSRARLPQIRGDALAFYARPAADLGEFEWQQLE